MGRFLLALSLIASMNFSGQKMLRDFKQKVNFVMYACFAIALLNLTGCASMAQGMKTFGEGLQHQSQHQYYQTQTNCTSQVVGSYVYTNCY
jgi:hypothetical protein